LDYWISVTYEGKSLEDKIFRAFIWLMIPFLSPFALLLLGCFVAFLYAFNLMVPFIISALLFLGFLIFKVCEKEMKEKGKI